MRSQRGSIRQWDLAIDNRVNRNNGRTVVRRVAAGRSTKGTTASRSDEKMAAIVGGVLGCILFVCLLLVLWQYRRSRRVRGKLHEPMPNHAAAELLARIHEEASAAHPSARPEGSTDPTAVPGSTDRGSGCVDMP